MELFNTVQKLTAAFGPSGDESGVASVIAELARPYADEIDTDVMGNLICHKKGNGPKVMFASHMDSLGLVVTHIEKEGFLRVAALGGISPSRILSTPVRFKNGTRGLISCDGGVSADKLRMDDLYIDIGVSGEEDAKKAVALGDIAVYDTPCFLAGERIVSPYLDNRISCAILLCAMEQLGNSDNDLYFVFTTQEELGLRGAKTAAYSIDPVYGITVDVTASADTPASKNNYSTVQGKGAAIKVMDRSVICHPRVVKKLEELAQEKQIAHQPDVKRTGGTDAGAMQPTRSGVYAGGITVPCRYTHSPTECICLADAENAVKLVCAFAESMLEKE
ncbi:MAG: M42 family metallopeptidase [Ruminococcaceae bacterium]|nr:M42 family metallopeptidase [Oscillospiraceae bacterium]